MRLARQDARFSVEEARLGAAMEARRASRGAQGGRRCAQV